MKNIFKIHILYYIVAIITILTGRFKDFIIINTIILFHELGHISMALYFKWKIKKIVLLPFGGLTIFDEYINRPIKEELLIAIMGPIYQIILYIFLFCIHIMTSKIKEYNLLILVFNLLPIIPLDGSKILNLILNKVFCFKYSHMISIVISLISIILLILYRFNLVIYMALMFLLIKTLKEFKEHKYTFNKFLFERYLYKFNFKKTKKINGINLNKMMRDKKHLFYKNHYITEYEILKKKFDKKSSMW